MQVSHESIYRTLFLQSRGALRKELTRNLRTERVLRRPKGVRLPDGRAQDTTRSARRSVAMTA
jgi:IS30 family transposase